MAEDLQNRMKSLYKALIKGDSKEVLKRYKSDIKGEQLTTLHDTVLHIATYSQHKKLVMAILKTIPQESDILTKTNDLGDTILHEAATTDMIDVVDEMLKAEQRLLTMRNRYGETPLFRAAQFGQTKMFKHLADLVVKKDPQGGHWRRKDGTTVLHITILAEFFETALQTVKFYPELLDKRDTSGMTGLQLLSSIPSAFKSGSNFGLLKRFIYYCVPSGDKKVPHDSHGDGKTSSEIDDDIDGSRSPKLPPTYNTCMEVYTIILRIVASVLGKINRVIWDLFRKGWPFMEDVWNEKRKHESAIKLAKVLIKHDTSWEQSNPGGDTGTISIASNKGMHPMHKASSRSHIKRKGRHRTKHKNQRREEDHNYVDTLGGGGGVGPPSFPTGRGESSPRASPREETSGMGPNSLSNDSEVPSGETMNIEKDRLQSETPMLIAASNAIREDKDDVSFEGGGGGGEGPPRDSPKEETNGMGPNSLSDHSEVTSNVTPFGETANIEKEMHQPETPSVIATSNAIGEEHNVYLGGGGGEGPPSFPLGGRGGPPRDSSGKETNGMGSNSLFGHSEVTFATSNAIVEEEHNGPPSFPPGGGGGPPGASGGEETSGMGPNFLFNQSELPSSETLFGGNINTEQERQPETPLLIATSNGIIEIVKEILAEYPQAVEHVNAYGQNILHVAVQNRQKNIFDVVKKMKIPMARLARRIDEKGNTILHHAASTENYRGSEQPGPALQLQEELLWFKRVKNVMLAHFPMHRNSEGDTALELFAQSHKKLLREGREWLKRTSESCSLVAVLIATVAFAAAYTIPGGPNQNTGLPILLNETFFLVFTVMDVLSLASSLTSVVMFLSILTSPFQLKDFEQSLPRKLTLGFTFLFFSVATMMLAFAATILLTIHLNGRWSTLLIYTVAFLPVTIFAFLQLPLYVALTASVKYSLRLIRRALPIIPSPCGALKGKWE